jgi:predicted acylesterase/phospholipase RssA
MVTQRPLPQLLLFSSGSVLTIGYLGALRVLDMSGYLADVTGYAGVSGGALVATALVLGYTIEELTDLIVRMDLTHIQNINDESPILLADNYGLDSGERVTRFIHALLRVKGWRETTTFADLSGADRPGLIVWATEMETCSLRRFSATETPTYTVCGALQASMCIPILFVPRGAEDTGHLLIDGGVLNHYPMAYLSAEERQHALGFYPRTNLQYESPTNIVDYLKTFISLIMRSKNDDTPDIFSKQTIVLQLPPCSPISFALTPDEKIAILKEGERAARKFLGDE